MCHFASCALTGTIWRAPQIACGEFDPRLTGFYPLRTGAFIEIWVHTQDLFPIQPKNFYKNLFPSADGPEKAKHYSRRRLIKKQDQQYRRGHGPPVVDQHDAIEDADSSSPQGQPLASDRCRYSKDRSFRCLPTWKSRWRRSKPNQIATGSKRPSIAR